MAFKDQLYGNQMQAGPLTVPMPQETGLQSFGNALTMISQGLLNQPRDSRTPFSALAGMGPGFQKAQGMIDARRRQEMDRWKAQQQQRNFMARLAHNKATAGAAAADRAARLGFARRAEGRAQGTYKAGLADRQRQQQYRDWILGGGPAPGTAVQPQPGPLEADPSEVYAGGEPPAPPPPPTASGPQFPFRLTQSEKLRLAGSKNIGADLSEIEKAKFTRSNALRDDYNKRVGTDLESFNLARAALAEQGRGAISPASDTGLVSSYVRLVDPGSVTREGEIIAYNPSMFRNLPSALQTIIGTAATGGPAALTPDARAQLTKLVRARASMIGQRVGQTRKDYTGRANRYGLNPADLIPGSSLDLPGPPKPDVKAEQIRRARLQKRMERYGRGQGPMGAR